MMGDSIFGVAYNKFCTSCGHRWRSGIFVESCPICGSMFIVIDRENIDVR